MIRCSITLILLILLLITQRGASLGLAAGDINFMLNGNKVKTLSPQPFIQDGKVLVPLRFIAEQLGAKVTWNNKDMKAYIKKDNRSVTLQIDSRLIEYDIDGKMYHICDVAPFIVEERTFVPLRIISNVLGVSIDRDNIERTIYIDTLKLSNGTPFYDLNIDTIEPRQRISGITQLQISFPEGKATDATEIKFLLLEPETRQGVVVARGTYNR